jgi:hypothetical protein
MTRETTFFGFFVLKHIDMERVVVTNPMIGICYMSVCAAFDATDE